MFQLAGPGAVVAPLPPAVTGCVGRHNPSAVTQARPVRIPLAPVDRRDPARLIGAEMRVAVIERDGRCLACGAACCLVADHILAHACGGRTDMGNLQTLCQPCNQRKKARFADFRGEGDMSRVTPDSWMKHPPRRSSPYCSTRPGRPSSSPTMAGAS